MTNHPEHGGDQPAHQDIGYLLTAYADGQLAPAGVMWVEDQLDREPDLRAKLKEIRQLQAGLRTAFAGGAQAFALDLPRRDALLASAAFPPRRRVRLPSPLWIGLAATVMAVVFVNRAELVGDAAHRGDKPMLSLFELKEEQALVARPEGRGGGGGFNAAPSATTAMAPAAPAPAADYQQQAQASDQLATRGRGLERAEAKKQAVPAEVGGEGVVAYDRTIERQQAVVADKAPGGFNYVVGESDALPSGLDAGSTAPTAKPGAQAKGDRLRDGELPMAKREGRARAQVELHESLAPRTPTAGQQLNKILKGDGIEGVTQDELLVDAQQAQESTRPRERLKPTRPAPVVTERSKAVDSQDDGAASTPESASQSRLAGAQSAPKWANKLPAPAANGKAAAAASPPPAAPAAGDGYVRLNNTLAYNGALTQSMPPAVNAPAVEPAKPRPPAPGEPRGQDRLIAAMEEPEPAPAAKESVKEQTEDAASRGREEAVASADAAGALTPAQKERLVELRRNRHAYLRQLGKEGEAKSATDARSDNDAEILALEQQAGAAAKSLAEARQSNNEKAHIAQVGKDVALKLNVQLAEEEKDYDDKTTASLQRQQELEKAKQSASSPAGQLAVLEGRYPKIAAGITATSPADRLAVLKDRYPKIAAEIAESKEVDGLQRNADGTTRKSYRVVDLARSMASFPGPDLDIPEPGGVGQRLAAAADPHAEMQEFIEIIKKVVAPASWDRDGASITEYNGQLVVNNTADVQRQVEELLTSLRHQQGMRAFTMAHDPIASMAFLRADMTTTLAEPVGGILTVLGGGEVAFRIAPAAEAYLAHPGNVAMRDEPVARGLVRLARGAGLQLRLEGGVVALDVARRPLEPSDAQGLDLAAFKQLFGTAPMQATAVDPVQTVAIDADTASYSLAKARIAAGQPIDPATIKPEHFINAMPMDFPPAAGPEAFALFAEAAPSPFARSETAWGARTALVAIGAVSKPAAADERRPLALTLAIDCSGSMAQPGALARVKLGLRTLLTNLRAEDRVALVAFGDRARVILPATPGNEAQALLDAVDALATGGATNAAEGLTLAYQLAAESAAPGIESRVLLATDGGTIAGADDLLRRVTAFKDRGITLVVVGCGQTYRAGPLQELASKGDGQHYFIGSDDEATRLFSTTLLPDHLAVLAKDAKLQVTWNPQRVSHARLVGYDQRRLAAKDFRDNAVDAGELSQDSNVTALFEVLLVDGGSGQLGTAAVRYYDTRRQQVRELSCPLPGAILASQASDHLRLLACAAATAEWLQRGWWSNVHLITPEEIRAQLARCPQPIAAELQGMFK